MPPLRILLVVVVYGCTIGCTRSDADRSVSATKTPVDAGIAGGRSLASPARHAGWESALDRINQRLAVWVKVADRAASASSTFSIAQTGAIGPDLWEAIQTCHCFAKPQWYHYFLGVARLADSLSSLGGGTVSEKAAGRLVQVYNETALAYNSVRTAVPFLPRGRQMLSGLDTRSFEHWLSKLLSRLLGLVRPETRNIEAVRGGLHFHRWALSIRAMWVAVQAEQTIKRLSDMSCRTTRSCRGPESRRDMYVRLLRSVAGNCRRAAQRGLLHGVSASLMENCTASWKRLEAQVARREQDSAE